MKFETTYAYAQEATNRIVLHVNLIHCLQTFDHSTLTE